MFADMCVVSGPFISIPLNGLRNLSHSVFPALSCITTGILVYLCKFNRVSFLPRFATFLVNVANTDIEIRFHFILKEDDAIFPVVRH
jgi:hypothetical protein